MSKRKAKPKPLLCQMSVGIRTPGVSKIFWQPCNRPAKFVLDGNKYLCGVHARNHDSVYYRTVVEVAP